MTSVLHVLPPAFTQNQGHGPQTARSQLVKIYVYPNLQERGLTWFTSWPKPQSLRESQGPPTFPDGHSSAAQQGLARDVCGTSLTGPSVLPSPVQCPASPPRTCGPYPSLLTWLSSPGQSPHGALSTASLKAIGSSSGHSTLMEVSLLEAMARLRVIGTGAGSVLMLS